MKISGIVFMCGDTPLQRTPVYGLIPPVPVANQYVTLDKRLYKVDRVRWDLDERDIVIVLKDITEKKDES